MNLNNFTIKAQEAIQKAQELAGASQHPQIETAHILKGILSVDENVIPFLLKKLEVDINAFNMGLENLLNGFSKVSGGQVYLSPDANTALQKALSYLKEFKDEFVSIEHILLGLLSVNDNTSKLLNEFGVNRKNLIEAIKSLRKGSSIKSRNAEDTFNGDLFAFFLHCGQSGGGNGSHWSRSLKSSAG